MKKTYRLITTLALLIFWGFLTILYIINFDTSFSIWSFNHPNFDIRNLNYSLIYRNETFKGEFIAKDNNLGIVSIRFQTYLRPPYDLEDNFLFRIKEKGTDNWYYKNIYRSGIIYDMPFFPFGFPQIKDSKNKVYDFEITSLNGNAVNGLSISTRYPVLVSKYKYSGHELLQNKGKLINFLIIKFNNAMHNPDVIFSSFIYLLPLIFYLAWISFLEKIMHPVTSKMKIIINRLEKTPLRPFIRQFKKIFIYNLDYFLVFVVIIDILIIQLTNDITYIIIAALWIATLRVHKENSKKSFITGLVFIVLCPLFLALKLLPIAEKLIVWAYMFFVAGTIQAMIEIRSKKNEKA